MLFSRFTPLGLFELSSEEPLAERMYNVAAAGLNDQYSLEEDDHMEGVIFANAIEGAVAAQWMSRGQAQRYAGEVSYMLPQREYEYGLVPGVAATMADRRAVFAARKRRPGTYTQGEIVSALQDLLGSDFLAYRTTPTAEVVTWPTNIGDDPMNLQLPSVPRKLVRLSQSVSVGLGAPQLVEYQVINVAFTLGQPLPTVAVGDVIVFDPQSNSVGEAVVVTALAGEEDDMTLLEATFDKPHAASALGTTQPFPMWTSTQRHVNVVLTPAAAVNPETRRKVDDFMRRAVRSTTRWSITAGSGGTLQTFQLDQPSLGFTVFEAGLTY